MTEPFVRPAVRGDLRWIMELLGEMHGHRSDDAPSEREREVFDQILRAEDRSIFVVEDQSHVVGTCDVLVVANLSRGARPWAMIENLSVALEHRRRGFGRALLSTAIRHAEDRGCYKVQLISNATRTEGHRLYESIGFDAPVRGFRRYLADID